MPKPITIPELQLKELREINGKCGKIIAILKGAPLEDDPNPTLLQQMLVAQQKTNDLLTQIVSGGTETAATLGLSGGTVVQKPPTTP